MNILSNLAILLRDLWAQKLRTMLTVFGIIWGTMSVILLLSFGAGVQKQNMKNMRGIGEGVVIVWGGTTGLPYKGFNKGRSIRLTEDDVALLRGEIREIQYISPEYSTRNAQVRGPLNVDQTNLTGIIPEYEDIRNVFPEKGGRFINDLDIEHNRRVAFVGNKLRDFLFGEDKEVIGASVLIDQTPFTIIGVLQKKKQNSSYNTRDENRIFIPASTFRAMFGYRNISNIVYKPYSPGFSKQIETRMYAVLGKKYTFDPADEDALWLWDTAEFNAIFEKFMLGFKVFLGLIGSFTLTVGGVGVANIMYVVVKERTSEIGVKRAVGAKKRHILFQFIFEAALIVAVGAMIGFVLAYGVVSLMQMLPGEMTEEIGRPILSGGVALTSMILLGFVALLAGYFPARRASLVDPVEALRGA
jgi:putative ABC transport system permease protein